MPACSSTASSALPSVCVSTNANVVKAATG
jgi:hypothetical protein